MGSPLSLIRFKMKKPLLVLLVVAAFFGLFFKARASDVCYRVIPAADARKMWETNHGYCGEVSLQVVGLQMGFWLGQNQARSLAGGEALLGSNFDKLLDSMHLQYTSWSGSNTLNDRREFLQWIKNGVMAGKPVIFAVKTHEKWGTDPDYDHILAVDAIGLAKTNAKSESGQWTATHAYNPDDILFYSDGFDGTETNLTFGQLVDGSTDVDQCYFLPSKATIRLQNGKPVKCEGSQYGVMITGQKSDSECLPIHLTSLSSTFEPDVLNGSQSLPMTAIVTMTNLGVGSNYVLLRLDVNTNTIINMPWTKIWKSQAKKEWQFFATNSAAKRCVTFMSDGITFFRLMETNNIK